MEKKQHELIKANQYWFFTIKEKKTTKELKTSKGCYRY